MTALDAGRRREQEHHRRVGPMEWLHVITTNTSLIAAGVLLGLLIRWASRSPR